MLCIDNPSTDAYFNLAAEEYLLKHYSQDIFMLYQNELSVIVGKYQDVKAEVNIDLIKKKKMKIARRISGGGTVFHDSGNINIVFIENTPLPDFAKYTDVIVKFLLNLGICAKADERHTIDINGLKISGSAQYIYKNRAMYHATLLYSSDLDLLTAVLDTKTRAEDSSRKYVKSVKSPVTNLSGYLQNPGPVDDFKKDIFDSFYNQDSGNNKYVFHKGDLDFINKLRAEKYAAPEWIYGIEHLSI